MNFFKTEKPKPVKKSVSWTAKKAIISQEFMLFIIMLIGSGTYAQKAYMQAGCAVLAGALGGILCTLIHKYFGRRVTLIFINAVGIAMWLAMTFLIKTPNREFLVFIQLMVTKILTGMVNGLGKSNTSRSIWASLGMIIFGCGLVYAAIHFIEEDLGFIRIMLLAYHTISLILLLPIFENKNSKNKEDDEEEDKLKKDEKSLFKSITRPEVYKPFILTVVLMFLQQLAGTYVIFDNVDEILKRSQIQISKIKCAFFVEIARMFVASFVMTSLFKKFSRRQAGIFSAMGMACCIFILAATERLTTPHFKYVSLGLIVAFLVCSSGVWALPFVLCSEMFPKKVEPACCNIIESLANVLTFMMLKLYPLTVEALQYENVFVFYGASALLTGLFIFVFVPETKFMTLPEIEEHFQGKGK